MNGTIGRDAAVYVAQSQNVMKKLKRLQEDIVVARQEIAVNETELSEDQSKLDTSNEQLREREQEITRQRGDVESLSAQLNFIQQKYLEQKDLDYPEYDRAVHDFTEKADNLSDHLNLNARGVADLEEQGEPLALANQKEALKLKARYLQQLRKMQREQTAIETSLAKGEAESKSLETDQHASAIPAAEALKAADELKAEKGLADADLDALANFNASASAALTSAKTDKAELEAAGTAAALEGTTKLTELDKREIEWTASVSELGETYATREASEREASACLGLGQDQLTAAKSKLDMQKKEDGLEKTNLATKNEAEAAAKQSVASQIEVARAKLSERQAEKGALDENTRALQESIEATGGKVGDHETELEEANTAYEQGARSGEETDSAQKLRVNSFEEDLKEAKKAAKADKVRTTKIKRKAQASAKAVTKAKTKLDAAKASVTEEGAAAAVELKELEEQEAAAAAKLSNVEAELKLASKRVDETQVTKMTDDQRADAEVSSVAATTDKENEVKKLREKVVEAEKEGVEASHLDVKVTAELESRTKLTSETQEQLHAKDVEYQNQFKETKALIVELDAAEQKVIDEHDAAADARAAVEAELTSIRNSMITKSNTVANKGSGAAAATATGSASTTYKGRSKSSKAKAPKDPFAKLEARLAALAAEEEKIAGLDSDEEDEEEKVAESDGDDEGDY